MFDIQCNSLVDQTSIISTVVRVEIERVYVNAGTGGYKYPISFGISLPPQHGIMVEDLWSQ